MGLFKSKIIAHDQAVAQRLLDDDFLDSVEYAQLIKQGYNRQTNKIDVKETVFNDTLRNRVMNNLPNKFKRAYSMANVNGRYVFGLPTSSTLENPRKTLQEVTLDYLQKQYGSQAKLLYWYIGDKNFAFYAWLKLVKEYNYDRQTHSITLADGKTAKIISGVIQLSTASQEQYNAEILEYTGYNYDGVTLGNIRYEASDDDTDKLVLQLQTVKENTDPVEYEDTTLTVELSDVNPQYTGQGIVNNDDIIQATLQVDDKIIYYEYIYGSGDNMQLDTALSVYNRKGEYYPRLYLKTHRIDVLKQSGTSLEHAKAMAKKLGLDLKQTTEDINKSLAGDVDKVHTMYISVGADMNKASKDNLIAEYLFKYFMNLLRPRAATDMTVAHRQQDGSVIESLSYGASVEVIQDNYTTVNIWDNGIVLSRHRGRYNNLKNKSYTASYQSSGKKDNIILIAANMFRSTHYLYYQRNDDEYVRIEIKDLLMSYNFGSRSVSLKGDDEGMFIPLDKSIVDTFSLLKKEELMQKTLHIQLLIYFTTKQKWYQKASFAFVVKAIGIIVAFVMAGKDGGTIGKFLIALAKKIAIGAAINLATKYLIKLAIKLGLDPKIAAIIVAVATVVMIVYKGTGIKDFRINEIMKVMNNGFNTFNKMSEVQLAQIQKEMIQYRKEMAEKQKRLEELQRTQNLGVPSPKQLLLLSPNYRYAMGSDINLLETPESFYNRSIIHDWSELAMSMTDNFVELSMQIPEKLYTPVSYEDDVEMMLIIQ